MRSFTKLYQFGMHCVPNFVGRTVSYCVDWSRSRNETISCKKEEIQQLIEQDRVRFELDNTEK